MTLVFLILILLVTTLSGCQKNAAASINALPEIEYLAKLDDALTSIREESNTLKTSLENDALTQTEMNLKAQELCELWDAALDGILDEAKNILPEDEWVKLTGDQNTWLKEKENAAKAAGKEFEGGSLYALTVNMESARITEERVEELYRILFQQHHPS